MAKFIFEKIIKANRKKVFDVTTNYENFQKILPQYYPSTRTISVRGNNSLVEEHLRIGGRELVMMAKHVVDEPILHEIFIVGGDAKGTHIITRYDQLSNGTRLTLEIDWKLKGIKKLGFFGKDKIPNEYSKMIDEFALLAEN
ncbi:MAG: polyketide cyclase [Nitrosopumilales archaeon CG_4_9_14_0_8_um_filter_34_10]|nr:MAG: polyketide cyclase [Nitrosopumilales archaeon CG_4_9_14_0_8_um_filter_34_10]